MASCNAALPPARLNTASASAWDISFGCNINLRTNASNGFRRASTLLCPGFPASAIADLSRCPTHRRPRNGPRREFTAGDPRRIGENQLPFTLAQRRRTVHHRLAHLRPGPVYSGYLVYTLGGPALFGSDLKNGMQYNLSGSQSNTSLCAHAIMSRSELA